ncbi:MAG: PHP domain-containing protein [Chlamydiia bacterium]|nr:PHP domain-containing protein [Chlamydiia bacterium]MCP5509714.1 PHP domain-containing protein [Chlamydiales bacterium]HPE84793.1 PHP domain-containing protein [Chlamydiales bacterium]
MEFRADLHCHSTMSDGTDSPEELLYLAKEAGLSGLSITDHDTLMAYTDALFEKARALGLLLGTGIELSCLHDKKENVHILGYGFDHTDVRLKAFCQKHQERRFVRNKEVIALLEKMGMPVGSDWLFDGNGKPKWGIGRPHIAEKLAQKGYVHDVRDAFARYLGDGKPAFVPSSSFSVEESIEILHTVKGKAFIAHPHLIRRRRTLNALLAMPFDGIECYYGNFSADQIEKWVKIACEKNWLISGGSDYHGGIKPETKIGSRYATWPFFQKIFNL